MTPYGLCNAGATYQRMLDLSLSGLSTKRVLAYIDDLLIFSTSLHSHLVQLREVLECLRQANISLNLSKCVFAMHEVEFLGYSFSDCLMPFEILTNRQTRNNSSVSSDWQTFIEPLFPCLLT